jgi:hypothetical protein
MMDKPESMMRQPVHHDCPQFPVQLTAEETVELYDMMERFGHEPEILNAWNEPRMSNGNYAIEVVETLESLPLEVQWRVFLGITDYLGIAEFGWVTMQYVKHPHTEFYDWMLNQAEYHDMSIGMLQMLSPSRSLQPIRNEDGSRSYTEGALHPRWMSMWYGQLLKHVPMPFLVYENA